MAAKEDLSRMEGTYGAELIGKLKQMKVFIRGLRGLGLETAKNIILTGPHTVVVQDDAKAVIADLGANFYLTPADVGRPRGEAVSTKLAELNPNVNVKLHTGDVTEAFLSTFQVVVVADNEQEKLLVEWNTICRKHHIVFLYASMLGMQCSVFADYGDKFVCRDADGEPLKTLIVDNISNGTFGAVTVDGERHLLSNGDHVKFEEVDGMSEPAGEEKLFKLEDKVTDINQTFVVKTTNNPKQFLIGNTSALGAYKHGGIINQVKVPVDIHHRSFSDQLCAPTFEDGYMDFMKFGRDAQLHLTRLALGRFLATHSRLPALHSTEDANELITLAKAINSENKEKKAGFTVDEVEEKVVRLVSLYATTETTALCALFGGVLAQEITKQSGKYRPISQWLHFDAFECIDETVPADGAVVGSRYDHQISLFGKAVQDRLEAQNVFLVGCGALGCEYMKAIALMGLGTKGKVSITDDDNIELSNLSRQFLFRRQHVGKPKSTSASESVVHMNQDLKSALEVYRIKVEPKTEETFHDEFWGKIDLVLNALDNMAARRYIDGKCVLYKKPLFESGTLGTKANTAICLPHVTPSYSEGVSAGEDGGIAMCTLRNFPSLPLHCIEWARTKFDEWFVSGADKANALLEDRDGFLKKLKTTPLEERESLETAKKWLEMGKAPNFRSCVEITYGEFFKNFRDQIKDLTHQFPADARNFRVTEDGEKIDLGPFWHGHKRFPNVSEFDASNDLHLDFVFHGASIFASIFGVAPGTKEEVKAIASELKAPVWAASDKKITLDEDKKGEAPAAAAAAAPVVSDEDDAVVTRLTEELSALDLKSYRKLCPADFEKDDDSNHHVDLITVATNLRSYNYSIKPSTRASVRMVAGKIIPAIATTTAMITGFAQLEIYKYVKKVDLSAHRGVTVNLATNTFCVELLPDPIKKKTGLDQETYMQVTAVPEGFTTWDTIEVKGADKTVGEFLEQFKAQHHGVVLDFVATPDGKTLYRATDESAEKQKTKKVLDAYTEIAGPVVPSSRKFIILEVSGEDADGNMAIVPRVQFFFA